MEELHRLLEFYQKIIEPPPSVKDPEVRRRARLFNGLTVMIGPVAVISLGAQLLVEPIEQVFRFRTVVPVILGIAVTLLNYLLNRVAVNFRIVSFIAILSGLIAILVVALTSSPPHTEFTFLIFLPLVSTILFSLWETFLIGLLTLACLIGIGSQMPLMPDGVLQDLIVFNMLSQAFILFVAQQRNRFELDRQQLALEKERTQLLSELLTNLSHDFRTPLSVINMSAEMMKYVQDTQKRQERIEQITNQTGRLNKILDDILYISRLDSAAAADAELLDLNTVLQAVSEKFRPIARSKNIQLTTMGSSELPLVSARLDHLQRVVTNLVENAIQHTPSGGSIMIRTLFTGDVNMIEVSDTGSGIAEADLPQIFDPFFRSDKARSADGGGAGLGLSIARRLIERYRGSLTVESHLGTGSTFRVTLPVTKKVPIR